VRSEFCAPYSFHFSSFSPRPRNLYICDFTATYPCAPRPTLLSPNTPMTNCPRTLPRVSREQHFALGFEDTVIPGQREMAAILRKRGGEGDVNKGLGSRIRQSCTWQIEIFSRCVSGRRTRAYLAHCINSDLPNRNIIGFRRVGRGGREGRTRLRWGGKVSGNETALVFCSRLRCSYLRMSRESNHYEQARYNWCGAFTQP
jgi:hypothetical protein